MSDYRGPEPGTGVYRERLRLERARTHGTMQTTAQDESDRLAPCDNCGHPRTAHTGKRYGVNANGKRIVERACLACPFPGIHNYRALRSRA